jgi:hypothetical protein
VQEYKTEKAADGTRINWNPVEVSLVALPADKGARIRSTGGLTEETLANQIRASGALLGIGGDFIDGLIARDGMTLEGARRTARALAAIATAHQLADHGRSHSR